MRTVAFALLLSIGCTTLHTDASDVYDCAKTEATAANLEDIIATFVSAVAGGTVTQTVESLAAKYGTAIVACSLAAIEAQPKATASMASTDAVGVAAAQQLSLHGWKTK